MLDSIRPTTRSRRIAVNLAERESLDRSGPGHGREPGRDSHRSGAKEWRGPGGVGARVYPRRGPNFGRLCDLPGRDVPAISSIRTDGTAGLRTRDVGAAPAR